MQSARLFFVVGGSTLLAAAALTLAADTSPQITDAEGDANGTGQSLQFGPTSFDIASVTFSTDQPAPAATVLTVTMNLYGPVCADDQSCGAAAYFVSADIGGCAVQLAFYVDVTNTHDGATATVCAKGTTLAETREVTAEPKDNAITWTLPLADFSGSALASGALLTALSASTALNLGGVTGPVLDQAQGTVTYTLGEAGESRPDGDTPSAPASGRQWVLQNDSEVSRYQGTNPDHCVAGPYDDNCFQLDTETEPSIAVNPENPLNAVAVFQSGRRGVGAAAINGYAVTFDGGNTWEHGLLPGLSTATGGAAPRVSDPVVAFGPGNRVYVNSLVVGDAAAGDLAVNASTDGGRTWANPSYLVDPRVIGTDKNWMVVDTGTGPGHHPGRVYVVWSAGVFFYAYSDDDGATWLPTSSGAALSPSNGVGAIPMVLPTGDLAVVWTTAAGAPYFRIPPDTTLTQIVFTVAKGAGQVPSGTPLAFTPPATISSYRGRDVLAHRGGESLVSAAADPQSGTIYVAWNDSRFRSDAANDIVLSSSTDTGLNWTVPVRVNGGDPGDGRDHFLPAVGVGPDGEVLVSYLKVNSKGGDAAQTDRGVATMLRVSGDGGRTFPQALRIDRANGDLAFAARSGGDSFLGDYRQLAVAGSRAYAVHSEPVRADPAEVAEVPSRFQHQRTWVAVVERGESVSGSSAEADESSRLGAMSTLFVAIGGLIGLIFGSRRRTDTDAIH